LWVCLPMKKAVTSASMRHRPKKTLAIELRWSLFLNHNFLNINKL
jgi:hypothetical protein